MIPHHRLSSIGLVLLFVLTASTPAAVAVAAVAESPIIEPVGWIEPPAELSSFDPRSVGIDFRGQVLVLDGSRRRVLRFSADGGFLGQFGTVGTDGAGMADPSNLAVFRGFVTLIADPGKGEIVRYDRFGRLLAGWRVGSDAGAPFNPWGIAVGDDGNVYVTDPLSGRIAVLGSKGEFRREIRDLGSDIGRFVSPRCLAVRGGSIYFTDAANDRVVVLNRWGRPSAAWGSTGGENGQFRNPWGIVVDVRSRVWVVDSGNRRLQVFTADGDWLAGFPSEGPGPFVEPGDMAIGSDGNFFVVDMAGRKLFRGRFREAGDPPDKK